MLIRPRNKNRLGAFAILFFVAMLAVQLYYGLPLYNQVANQGIVSLELARDVAKTDTIFKSWGSDLKPTAIKSLVSDYGFLASYGLLSALAARWAGRKMAKPWNWPAAPRVGEIMARLAILAAFLDTIENASLLWQLFNTPARIPAFLAWACATVKFSLLFVVIAFVMGGVIASSRFFKRIDASYS